jgi:carboxyl-terminal processing protease
MMIRFSQQSLAFFLACVVSFFALLSLDGCGFSPLQRLGGPETVTDADSARKKALDLYHEAWQVVFNEYVDAGFNGQNWYRWKDRYNDQIQTEDDAYAAIRTMLTSLNDPYTRFLDPKRADDQNMHIDSRLFGVGIQIAGKDNQFIVIAPLEGSPAMKAGIRSMDRIIKINNEPTANMTIDDVVDRIRGAKGTPVTLTINRTGKQLEYKLVRDEIVIKTVFGNAINKDIGYIRLSSFISQDTSAEMRQKILSQKDTKAMIVDIRGNNGGLLPNALEISDMFLKKGEIVSIVDRTGSRRSFMSKHVQIYNKPVVLLIDEGSASASEILGGALKDNDRATLIGAKTFGKGLVQKINYLADGSELNLTISKYYTPSGQDIDKKGIEPDITIPLSEKDVISNRDPQKDAAIRYLEQQILVNNKAS